MKLTSALLRKHGACASARAEFKALFPRGVVVTEALCLEHKDALAPHVNWLVMRLFPASARQIYEEATASAFGRIAETL
jgi:hypothetical protein